mmetsp:Transcript_31518/g.96424  ORF Transcript_31518/g.96424 Transcript_31518/m.96424 type:complete len:224 (+) Transcript_31518:538-1209(+)
MSAMPALSGRSEVRSCEPPSGKMPTDLPATSAAVTAENMPSWSTCGIILNGSPSASPESTSAAERQSAAPLAATGSRSRTASSESTSATTPLASAAPLSCALPHETESPGLSSERKRVPTPRRRPRSSGEATSRPVPATVRSCGRSTGITPRVFAAHRTYHLRIDAAAVRKQMSGLALPIITSRGSRNWFACGAQTKSAGSPALGSLKVFLAPISRKKISRTR